MSIQLFDYQEAQMPALLGILNDPAKKLAIVAASTGTGKTYMTLELMRRFGRKFGVVAPKATLGQWTRSAAALGVEPEFVRNPEALRTGNHPRILKKLTKWNWDWVGLGRGDVLVLDESHRYNGMDSMMAAMAANASRRAIKVVALSATLADSVLKTRALLHLGELVPWAQFPAWARSQGCFRDTSIQGAPWRSPRGRAGVEAMERLNKLFFPAYGIRLDSKDIPNYPTAKTIIELATPSEKAAAEARAAYEFLAEEIKHPERATNDMVQILRARQCVEHAKIPVMVELAEDALADGMSVAVFWNFTAPMAEFCRKMAAHSPARVYGTDESGHAQSQAEREAEIARFQSNQTRLFAGTIAAGGVGVSLGDSDGRFPRYLMTSLPLSSQELIQCLGRCARADSKSPTLNRVVLLDGVPVEERVFRILSQKVNNLSAMTGDELSLENLLE